MPNQPGDARRNRADETTTELLARWRRAEREAGSLDPNSAAGRRARKAADHAREAYHDREDEAHVEAGDIRPRSTAHSDADEVQKGT